MTAVVESNRPIPAGELCLATFVFGGHMRYVPYYVYSALKAYPDAWVKVFHEEPLPERVDQALTFIRASLSTRFETRQHSLEAPARGDSSLRVDPRTFVRFLLPPEELAPFEVAYVGDVDMFYLHEEPTLLEFHRAHMRSVGLPISNCVRRAPDGSPTRRLTGLHCFETGPYFRALSPLIDRLSSDGAALAEFVAGLTWDEEALFKLVASEFDLEPLKASDCPRPWHGLHLGAARKHRPTEATQERFAANSALSREDCANAMAVLLEDTTFDKLLRICPEKSVLNYLMFLELRPGSVSGRAIAMRHALVSRLKDLKRYWEARPHA